MPTNTYYVLKVKGKAKIPDYIQVRDESFTLIGYFRPERHANTTRKIDEHKELFAKIELLAESIPFGQVTKIEI
jgi:hypothetical protein